MPDLAALFASHLSLLMMFALHPQPCSLCRAGGAPTVVVGYPAPLPHPRGSYRDKEKPQQKLWFSKEWKYSTFSSSFEG